MKRFLCLSILLSATTPIWAQPQPVPEAPPDFPAMRLANGAIITPLKEERNDIATLTEINLWRFQIQLPTPDLQLNFRVELRRPNQETIEMIKGDYWPTQNTEFVLGLMPKGSESLDNAEMLKVYTGSYAFPAQGLNKGDSYSLRQCKNPIKDLKIVNDFLFLKNRGIANADGSIPLGRFYAGVTQEPSKSELFLILSTQKRPEPAKP
ncbi:MAG TPA: hypothetical protein VF627_04335 [Abditibacterium sp.]|jgi:hypothetical protein